MAILDMFDKLDDIIYKPVETVCDWIKAPLNSFEHKRDMKKIQQAADIEAATRQQEVELEVMRQRQAAELQADQRKWNAEIDQLINQQEEERRDRLVESIKRYQIELANASRDIVNSIGLMSLELREKANNLVIEKTREYKKIQDEAKKQSLEEIQQAKDMFFDTDPDTYKILVGDIMNERRTMVDTASKFITELSEDLKRLNENSDKLMCMGMQTVTDYLKPLTQALGTNNEYLPPLENTITVNNEKATEALVLKDDNVVDIDETYDE